ncbi:hypothetical protein BH11BAC3_BH11BAC3_22580 [soil metagenome]
MANKFNTILIPVDFSINTQIAIAKALEISTGNQSNIHLFHVQQVQLPGLMNYLHHFVSGYSVRDVIKAKERSVSKLQQLKNDIHALDDQIPVSISVAFGEPVENAIAKKAFKLHADLIVIGKHSHHSMWPFLNTIVPSRLATTSGIPVFTTKPGSLNNEIKTVVITVDKKFPGNKLAILEALRRKSMNVRLVTFTNGNDDASYSKQTLLNAFRSVKSKSIAPIECEVLTGSNKARALLKYCYKVGADVLIVNPEIETKVGMFGNLHISDLLPADSKTQVLAVKPALFYR